MDLAFIVEGEHEQALGQIEVHSGELAIVELGVLRTIRQVNEKIYNFLATLCGADLVQLIKLQHRIHTAGANQ